MIDSRLNYFKTNSTPVNLCELKCKCFMLFAKVLVVQNKIQFFSRIVYFHNIQASY